MQRQDVQVSVLGGVVGLSEQELVAWLSTGSHGSVPGSQSWKSQTPLHGFFATQEQLLHRDPMPAKWSQHSGILTAIIDAVQGIDGLKVQMQFSSQAASGQGGQLDLDHPMSNLKLRQLKLQAEQRQVCHQHPSCAMYVVNSFHLRADCLRLQGLQPSTVVEDSRIQVPCLIWVFKQPPSNHDFWNVHVPRLCAALKAAAARLLVSCSCTPHAPCRLQPRTHHILSCALLGCDGNISSSSLV
jgi:hypothetical protein